MKSINLFNLRDETFIAQKIHILVMNRFFNPHSVYIFACFASGNTAKVIIGNRKNSKDAPLLIDMIKDPAIERRRREKMPLGGWIPSLDL